jgi:hypothetical protein
MGVSKRLMLMSGAAALLALSFLGTSAEPAQAQFGIGLPGLGGLRFHFGPRYYRGGRGGGYSRRHRGGGSRSSGNESASDEPAPRKSKDEKVVVSAGAPTVAEQTIALRRVALATTGTGDMGSAKDLKEVGKVVMNDRERDYTTRIKEIIKRFTDEQDKDATPGDVTAAAIEQSLDKAFKAAKLETFERFKTESWTSERLRTMILDRVQNQIGGLFKGNNKGNAPMAQLDAMIQRASEDIYSRIFETSELLAANKSSSLFMQRLYQAHGALVKDELRENADYIITKASLTALSAFEQKLLREDKLGYAYRYRGQRIVFDCLSDSIEDVTKGDAKIATVDEIRARVAKISTTVCSEWLSYQFGAEKEIKAQQPVAMRTIWSKEGPMLAL